MSRQINIINKIKQNITKEINQAVKADIVEPENLVYPPQENMGDLSLPCFVLAKSLKKNPAEIAEFLVKNIISLVLSGFWRIIANETPVELPPETRQIAKL